jgi:hypothetical protein
VKSVEKISLTFGIMVLLAIVMFFIGLYYNLSLAKTSLAILIPVVLIAIITFADLEKERYFSQREGGIILFICLLFPIILFVSFVVYQKDFKNYIVDDSLTDNTEYKTIYVVEPALSLVKAMEGYVESKLSNDEEKTYMRDNLFHTIKDVDNNEMITYPLFYFGGVICLNDINSKLCKIWLDRLVVEIKDKVKQRANKADKEYVKKQHELEDSKKKMEEADIFKKDNKLN